MIRALKNLLESKAVHYILFGIFVCAFNIALPESTAAAKKVRFTTKIPEIYKPFLSGIGSLQVGSNIYCTAFCVSKSTIATAQHCVLTKNERWRSSALNIRFSLELKGKVKTSKILGRSTAERRPNIAYGLKSWSRRSRLYGGKKRNRKKFESDWALIKLEHKICTITLPINNLIGLKFRTRPGKDFAAAVSAEKFNTRKRRNRWTFRGKCRFLEKIYLSYEALIVHDCEGRPGISGAPFFLRDDDGNFGVVALDTGDANT
jgi:V8-like Glu-specific endopeptidase